MSPFTVADAIRIAREAHAGQTDKQGRDYFTGHLVPIAESVAHLGDDAVCAAYLHDLIEDTDWDADRLRAAGAPEHVVAAVLSVTRRPGETYEELITRSCADPLGVHVKLADNAHNIASNPALAQRDPTKAYDLLVNRYLPARDRLIEARTRHTLGLSSPDSRAGPAPRRRSGADREADNVEPSGRQG